MGSRQETQSITTCRLESTFDSVVQEFDLLWQSGQRPQIEQQLLKVPETERAVVLARLVTLEIEYRRCHGETPTPDR